MRFLLNIWSQKDPMFSDEPFYAVDDNGKEYIVTHGGRDGSCYSTPDEIEDRTVICCYMQQVAKTGIKVLDDSVSTEVIVDTTGEEEDRPAFTDIYGDVVELRYYQYSVMAE